MYFRSLITRKQFLVIVLPLESILPGRTQLQRSLSSVSMSVCSELQCPVDSVLSGHQATIPCRESREAGAARRCPAGAPGQGMAAGTAHPFHGGFLLCGFTTRCAEEVNGLSLNFTSQSLLAVQSGDCHCRLQIRGYFSFLLPCGARVFQESGAETRVAAPGRAEGECAAPVPPGETRCSPVGTRGSFMFPALRCARNGASAGSIATQHEALGSWRPLRWRVVLLEMNREAIRAFCAKKCKSLLFWREHSSA